MGLLKQFGTGLQKARKSRGLTQEDFSLVSSRTYLSSLERGIKAPTITKIHDIAAVLGVHPLSLVAFAYLPTDVADRKKIFSQVIAELESFEDQCDSRDPP
ncbi:MAG: XRE family transcriptional regulator [Proteobacteria bacterium]|nr:MAG: XRE family transcriptional regulator [Pseudomonadota bacterium]